MFNWKRLKRDISSKIWLRSHRYQQIPVNIFPRHLRPLSSPGWEGRKFSPRQLLSGFSLKMSSTASEHFGVFLEEFGGFLCRPAGSHKQGDAFLFSRLRCFVLGGGMEAITSASSWERAKPLHINQNYSTATVCSCVMESVWKSSPQWWHASLPCRTFRKPSHRQSAEGS